jgi:hypothetical protein
MFRSRGNFINPRCGRGVLCGRHGRWR